MRRATISRYAASWRPSRLDADEERSATSGLVSSDPREHRLAALRSSLSENQIDALLVSALPNVRYLSGFSGSAALLLVTHNELLLLTDFRYAIQADQEVGAVAQIIIEPTSLWSRLSSSLNQMKSLERIGFESANLSHADFGRLAADQGKASRRSWWPVVNLVEILRAQKDAGEITAIREAVRIAEVALTRSVENLYSGMTELEIGGVLERNLREAGSATHPFEVIVATGERSALPHAHCSSRNIAPGEWLLIDFGAVFKGYCSDITRTFVMGRASEEQKELYTVVRESNAIASAGVRAGMRGRDADALSRDYIARQGWGAEFGHSLGHGIGLEVHEAPRLSRGTDAPLPQGAVVTIEPGIYRPGWGGVRIEDDVLLSADGSQVLTTFSRDLLELG